jgi:hypothetical protein
MAFDAAMLFARVRTIQMLKYFTSLDDNYYECYATERHPEVIPFLKVRYSTALNKCCILR